MLRSRRAKAKTRPAVPEDAGRVECIHTALVPIRVVDRGDGVVRVVSLLCANCQAVLVVPRTQTEWWNRGPEIKAENAEAIAEFYDLPVDTVRKLI